MWKTIEGYPDYQISDGGEVKSFKHRKPIVLKPSHGSSGYSHVLLYQNDKRNDCNVHRLVLVAFVGKCPAGMEANHIDGSKPNNRLDNLEYVTHSENQLHAFQIGLKTPNIHGEIAVEQFTKDGQFIAKHKSQSEAFRQTGAHISDISRCCLGKRKSAGGFRWEFANAS